MDAKTPVQAPPAATASMDHSEEMLAEVDEPPDELKWSPTKLHSGYSKTHPSMQRRESLLTRQLHSETEHTTDEEHMLPGRAMSATSMTELTSDDGHSVPSPVVSPPLAPTLALTTVPSHEKTFEHKVKIAGLDDTLAPVPETSQEQTVEANLGRKRCISFQCRGKQESKPAPPPTSQPAKEEPTSPPKRKCMLKFACPTRSSTKPAEPPQVKRAVSPPPPVRRTASKTKHRNSDSTVTQASPKSVRKPSPATIVSEQTIQPPARRYSADSDDDAGNEATRFHEFATSEEEPEAWVQESTCHRTRLTVDDTLKKENMIRKTCEEVEEEALEEDEEEEKEETRDDLAIAGQDEDDEYEDDESDAGFHSDDEDGFANSDSERDDDSDYEWWRPGGPSTAATSVEHLDRLAIVNSQAVEPGSSVNSASSAHLSPRSSRLHLRKTNSKHTNTQAISINRPPSPELPDSTDFVCGTLDEDRPIEQAYINRKKAMDAANRPARPQDIDPSFPTSDPEMDEEDDDDVDEVAESDEDDDMMHGALDELDEPSSKKFTPPQKRGRRSAHRSPPPPARLHPSPAPKRTSVARSPPPPKRARSPPPRKLFGHSPRRTKSPAPPKRMTSPANSPAERGTPVPAAPQGLAGRPQPTHTASVPRNGPVAINRLAYWGDMDEETDAGVATEIPKRGAIDIFKGVELKRQRRKDKLHQKMCAKYAMKEKTHKVKPGKGAERMREVGLQLQNYRGKAEHILSL